MTFKKLAVQCFQVFQRGGHFLDQTVRKCLSGDRNMEQHMDMVYCEQTQLAPYPLPVTGHSSKREKNITFVLTLFVIYT
jgi:hypothetical protein